MQFTIEDRGTYTEVVATGRLNMVSAPTLRSTVDQAVAAGSRHLVINLASTEFMDSSGLGALIGCLKVARQAGGDLRIACVQKQVQMVLELTNMNRVLAPYATVEEAFARD